MCEKWITVNHNSRHHLCKQCKHDRYADDTLSQTSSPPPSLFPSPSIFNRPDGCLDPLTPAQCEYIITSWTEGMSRDDIAHKIHCSLKTVGHWIREWQQNHSVEEKERSGRHRSTDEETDERIISLAEEKKFITPKEIANELQLHVSTRTIRNRLDEIGLYGRVARKEYPFTAEHIRKRLSFAEGYLHWSESDWDRVLFSDETHIELGPHGQVWVQRPLGAAFDPDYMSTHVPHPQRVSLWACFSGMGIGQAEIFIETLDGGRLKEILAHNLIPTAHDQFPSGAWWLLQDNDPKHKSKIVQQWLHNNGVNCIDFPPYSPDLNPIENLFSILKRRVEKRRARNTTELEQHLKEEWEGLDHIFLSHLSHSMPSRCHAVVSSKGHKIDY